mmetsp:Transcript_111825/g.203228  ORF Transcript_111825/g.203228 Transcript_111825/m.203228 type:complete len:163 (-) Transcript_111825:41-529(-)
MFPGFGPGWRGVLYFSSSSSGGSLLLKADAGLHAGMLAAAAAAAAVSAARREKTNVASLIPGLLRASAPKSSVCLIRDTEGDLYDLLDGKVRRSPAAGLLKADRNVASVCREFGISISRLGCSFMECKIPSVSRGSCGCSPEPVQAMHVINRASRRMQDDTS